uniref:mannosyl-oligosaccharide 1,3-1,6-alpha-mannosidase n=1 Tax=Oncorhynchus tshawytscha TaxID=74940 RepID=A0A8C8JW44_ONCTS
MMKRLNRQVTVFGSAIFCVVVFSLYLMLDHLQLDNTKSPNNGGDRLQNGQLSILQGKIDRLERLLAENNEIITNIRDSVINLKESVKDGVPGGGNMSQGPYPELLALPPLVLPIDSQDCQFAAREFSEPADGVQLLDVYDLLTFDNPDGGVWKQGFDITYQENEWDSEPLQVFVVPHSHNDPGWLKTFDDYYRDQTQHILNNMVVKLHEDSRRKMIWSEISYFSKWWDNIDGQKRDAVKSLVERGQLEITTGGWVMPDEANSHYFALIDQLLEGHQWLERNLGVKPETGWAVDPFGYSPTNAYLLKQAGLANMLIQRVHYSVKKHFASQKTLEFFWRQNWDPASSTDILCHMMPFYSYDVPHTCGPDPKICCQFDFKRLPGGRVSCPWRVPPQPITDGNVQQRVQMLLDQYRKKSKLFRTKVVMVPLGDDFRYTEALEWDQQFQNYQKLFDYMNSHPELHVKAQFGTITDYFNALRKSATDPGHTVPSLPVVSGDFFTYADRDDHYWSGYFTSRPFYKRLDRVLESHLRAAEIIYSLTLANIRRSGKRNDFPAMENYRLLTEARRNLGLFQHHDAITGTGKELVVIDYGIRLFHSILNLKQVIVNSAHWLVLKDKSAYSYNPSKQLAPTCLFSYRPVVVYNPTEQDRTSVVTVYVNTPHVRVVTDHGRPVPAQVSAVWSEPTTASTEAFQVQLIHIYKSDMYSPARPPVIRVTKGSVFSEITTTFDHVTHTLRLYHVQGVEGQSVEICNSVDIRGEFNREITMRLTSDVDSKDRFFTDLNGFQIQSRKTMAKLPLQANFYPMTSMAYLQDPGTRLTLLTAQSLGSASLKSGQLEVIMDRRLNQDDNRGMGQGVLDNKVTASSFRLLLEKRKLSTLSYPSLLSHVSSLYLNHPLIPMAVSTEAESRSLSPLSPLASSLPCDVHLVNLRTIQSKEGGGPSDEAALILHRKGFDCALSNRNTGLLCATTQGKIRMGKLFSELKFQSITPASLTLMHTPEKGSNQEEISLKPMEISTYRVQLT